MLRAKLSLTPHEEGLKIGAIDCITKEDTSTKMPSQFRAYRRNGKTFGIVYSVFEGIFPRSVDQRNLVACLFQNINLKDSFLLYNTQIRLPLSTNTEILEKAHDDKLSGHVRYKNHFLDSMVFTASM